MKTNMFFALALLCANFCKGYTLNCETISEISTRTNYGFVGVDFQRTFSQKSTHNPEAGSLAVPGANQEHQDGIIRTATIAKNKKIFVALTRDYHPQNHCSLMSNYIDAKGNTVTVAPGTKIKD